MLKNIQKNLSLIICLLILASIPTALCSEALNSNINPNINNFYPILPSQSPISTPINETTNYQDSQWLATYTANSLIIGDDLIHLSTALENINFTSANNDFTSISTCANTVYKDSQKAMNNSDLYNVSPDLQSAKDEYKSEMAQFNSATVCISYGVKEYKKGNIEAGYSEMKQAIQTLKSITESTNRINKLIKAYKIVRSYEYG